MVKVETSPMRPRVDAPSRLEDITASPGFDYDLAIVGGGIVGATLAAALHRSGLSVVIIEAEPQSVAIAKGQAYAVHLRSRQIWEAIGVWDAIAPQVEYFNQVWLTDGDDPHRVTFQPQDLKTDILGYVAEHRVLLGELLRLLQDCPAVTWLTPVQVSSFATDADGVTLHLNPSPEAEPFDLQPLRPLRVKLVVGADGARSRIRDQAGIQTKGCHYWQSCVVATITPEKFHQHRAYERFWPSGPFAILPTSAQQCRIVWTAPHEEAKAIAALDDATFVQELRRRYGPQMGQLEVSSPRYTFAAKLTHARTYIKPRVALVGDAAHSCHPVGGQGLNLGIRDAAALAAVLCAAHQRGQDIGQLPVLRRYDRWRRWQNALALGFTDLLNRMFSNTHPGLTVIRRLGLRLMAAIPLVRVLALKFMAGLLLP
jgi:2-octaprenyl-6-methoxyphenol hydroxylase